MGSGIQVCWVLGQAIERQGTSITYLQLLYSMTQALQQLQASQGNMPPKLPPQVGGMFGGLVNKLVRNSYFFVSLPRLHLSQLVLKLEHKLFDRWTPA